jgi:hypothetical protein
MRSAAVERVAGAAVGGFVVNLAAVQPSMLGISRLAARSRLAVLRPDSHVFFLKHSLCLRSCNSVNSLVPKS